MWHEGLPLSGQLMSRGGYLLTSVVAARYTAHTEGGRCLHMLAACLGRAILWDSPRPTIGYKVSAYRYMPRVRQRPLSVATSVCRMEFSPVVKSCEGFPMLMNDVLAVPWHQGASYHRHHSCWKLAYNSLIAFCTLPFHFFNVFKLVSKSEF